MPPRSTLLTRGRTSSQMTLGEGVTMRFQDIVVDTPQVCEGSFQHTPYLLVRYAVSTPRWLRGSWFPVADCCTVNFNPAVKSRATRGIPAAERVWGGWFKFGGSEVTEFTEAGWDWVGMIAGAARLFRAGAPMTWRES